MQNSVMVNLEGFGNVRVSEVEYTSEQLITAFTEQMNTMRGILDNQDNSSVTLAANYDKLVQAAGVLGGIAKQGVTVQLSSFSYQDYLTPQMVTDLNTVLKFMAASGIDPSGGTNLSPAQKAAAMLMWKNNAGYGLASALIDGSLQIGKLPINLDGTDPTTGQSIYTWIDLSPTKTLQSMIETEYVKTANDVISTQLLTMKNALNISTTIVSTLTDLQNLHNNLTINFPGNPNLPDGATFTPPAYTGGFPITQTSMQTYIQDYENAANAYFSPTGSSVPQPVVAAGISTTRWLSDYQTLKDFLAQLNAFQAANPNLDELTSVQPLVTTLNSVISDIDNALANNGNVPLTAMQAWIMDNYNKAFVDTGGTPNQGIIQSNLSTAMLNAQNLNQMNKQNVQASIQIFEQFYKSSAAMLKLLSKLIVDFATGTQGA